MIDNGVVCGVWCYGVDTHVIFDHSISLPQYVVAVLVDAGAVPTSFTVWKYKYLNMKDNFR